MDFVIIDNPSVTAQFQIGSTICTVNGVQREIATAPYIKDGRTWVPVRDVALALGVTASNITWDQSTETMTIVSGETCSQFTVGSTTMLINGAALTMDVPPEMIGSEMTVTARYMGEALGATSTWDAANQTIIYST